MTLGLPICSLFVYNICLKMLAEVDSIFKWSCAGGSNMKTEMIFQLHKIVVQGHGDSENTEATLVDIPQLELRHRLW